MQSYLNYSLLLAHMIQYYFVIFWLITFPSQSFLQLLEARHMYKLENISVINNALPD